MNNNNAGFLVFLGVAIAAAIGAFFVAPKLFKLDGETATQSAPAANLVDSSVSEPQAAPDEAPGTEVASAEPGEPAGADSWVTPSFDVLRVEPDGSTVIAGKAEPGTTLSIMNGETVIASTKVGPSGDFAAVLDEPLPAGDYQLTLQTVGTGGETLRSEEVATVSIPEDASGELLAMVSKPGKASRIIAQPEAPVGDRSVEMASAGSAETEQAATSAVPETSAPVAAASETAAPDTTAPETATAPETEAAKNAAASATQEPSGVETPALPDASSLMTTTAPEMVSEGEADAEWASETANASGVEAVAGANAPAAVEPDVTAEQANEPAEEVAMATPDAAAEQAAPQLPAGANVRIDAIEIEGDRIFVAGSATPGSQVRVSADGVVIGTEKADETGRFIVEATSALSVGEHIISADLMDSAGRDVLLRATVPFDRPEGESLAAVAPSEPATPDAAALIRPDIASLSKMREDSFEALSRLKQMVSAPEKPDASAVSAAYVDTVTKLQAAAMADLPEGSSDEAMAMAQSMRAQAEAALAAISPPATTGTEQPAATGAESTVDLEKLSDTVSQAETALSEPAEIAVAVANAPDPAAAAGGQGEPRTIVQAPLASTPGAVIIRRGDTLWQISRRTYGQGVRYTTIYVANRSQIENPDRIKPGQVFSVPESPLENAEELHKELLDPAKNSTGG